ncbi:MAG: phosphoribosylamine--glycine ligase [Actinomycetota bacterium]|nr:phosphoribosylamine--glycine ligase [Actinomycetota bacterium]
MRVLLLGGGGREHAIGWKLCQSPHLSMLLSAPGNPGLSTLGPIVPGFDAEDPVAVADLADRERADLVVVGPEAPLAAGVVDLLHDRKVPVFGPSRAAARLETSKRFANTMMERAGVPTGASASFADETKAIAYLESQPGPYVVKADGLAAGKGVLVTDRIDEAVAWVRRCLSGGFGDAGFTVVIEEFLDGEEVSVFALCDGERSVPLDPARDYKRLLDDDLGPNTGGMGSYAPVDDLPHDLVAATMTRVIDPVLGTLAADGVAYRGFLYAGLMLTSAGMEVLEFNCRLGDPETQVVLPRLEEDFLTLLTAGAAGDLPSDPLRWSDTAAVDVVLAAPGYPESPQKGLPITGLAAVEGKDDVLVFHAGTATDGEGLVTSGGRVLNIVGLGATREEARAVAYDAAMTVDFPGKQMRMDIGT